MESRNKFEMCRLCLCENECFVNIFEMNDWQGYVASEVISDLLQFQVSETNGYPHVICLACLTKLTDFKLFKERCLKSKVTYGNMLALHESVVEHKPEIVDSVAVKEEPIYYPDNEDNDSKPIIKPEELDIDSSVDESDEPFKGNNTEASFGPISLKDEVLSLNRNSQAQENAARQEMAENATEQKQTNVEGSSEYSYGQQQQQYNQTVQQQQPSYQQPSQGYQQHAAEPSYQQSPQQTYQLSASQGYQAQGEQGYQAPSQQGYQQAAEPTYQQPQTYQRPSAVYLGGANRYDEPGPEPTMPPQSRSDTNPFRQAQGGAGGERASDKNPFRQGLGY